MIKRLLLFQNLDNCLFRSKFVNWFKIEMDFNKHIRDLLYLEDCVILPGLGAFISNFKPAEIREETQTFFPPTKEIGFNAELKEDDSLLVNFIAGKERISTEQAEELVYEKITDIDERLKTGQTVSLEGIGTFSLSGDGVILFKALSGVNFFIESYGLSAFHFPELEQEKESFIKRSMIFSQAEPVIRELLPGSKADGKKRDYSLRRIAIAVPALILLSVIPYNAKISESIFRHPASLGPLPSLLELDPPVNQTAVRDDNQVYFYDQGSKAEGQESIRQEGKGQRAEEQKAEGIGQKAEEQKAEGSVAESKEILPYPIIAGSFQSGYNANRLIRQLAGRGYKPEAIQAPHGYIRVVLARYPSLESAQEALYDLKKSNLDLSLWILK